MTDNLKIPQSTDYLTGQLLLAMPNLIGSSFEKSVIYICSHDEKGAMGIIINQPLPSVSFDEIISQLKLDGITIDQNILPNVHFGGPVEMTRGFVLHSTDHVHKDTVVLNDELGVTATVEILRDIVTGDGPDDVIFALGYAGWGAGQLEAEIEVNSWLSSNANPNLIFHTSVESKWDKALETMGVDPALLSSFAGNA